MMKRLIISGVLFFAVFKTGAQNSNYAFYELYQLDSIGQSISPGSHFGELYYHFLLLVEKKLQTADTGTIRLVRHFEQVFAQFYIDACYAFREKKEIPLAAWRNYFKDTTLTRAQYFLLGANAHLNGGLAQAIAGSYTPREWKKLKNEYVLFNSCLNQTLRKVYDETIRSSEKAKNLSVFSFDLTRPLSHYYLYKWRKRQMRLADYYYEGSSKYEKLLKKVNRKKEKIDRMIQKNIS